MNYSELVERTNYTGVVCYLQATSVFVLLSALSHLYAGSWKDNGADLTAAQRDVVDNILDTAVKELVMSGIVGAVLPFAAETLPEYCLICDGSTYDKADYPALWEVTPEANRTSDTFDVPDLINLFIRAGTPSTLGDTGGEDSHTLSDAEMPAHSHSYVPVTLNLDLESPGVPDIQGAGIGVPTTTGSAGGGQAHENRPSFYTLVFAIVAR